MNVKRSHLGTVLMIIPPALALGLGWVVFFPVALTSVVGGMICFMSEALATHVVVGRATAELVRDLASADRERREWVLSEVNDTERKWFLAEIARIETEPKLGASEADRRPGEDLKAPIGKTSVPVLAGVIV